MNPKIERVWMKCRIWDGVELEPAKSPSMHHLSLQVLYGMHDARNLLPNGEFLKPDRLRKRRGRGEGLQDRKESRERKNRSGG